MKRPPTPLATLHEIIDRIPEHARTESALELVTILTHCMIADNQWSPHRERQLTLELKRQYDLPIEAWENQR